MTQPLSHRFIEALAAPRDRLYGLAISRAGTPAAAELTLQQRARELFAEVTRGSNPDIAVSLEKSLESPASAGESVADVAMPADVWARLAAAIQLEAARSSHSQALNPDSVLLRPDPLLAPKKTRPVGDGEEFDVASPTRMLVAIGAILLMGILTTVYIVTRPAPQRPATHPASPASAPVQHESP